MQSKITSIYFRYSRVMEFPFLPAIKVLANIINCLLRFFSVTQILVYSKTCIISFKYLLYSTTPASISHPICVTSHNVFTISTFIVCWNTYTVLVSNLVFVSNTSTSWLKVCCTSILESGSDLRTSKVAVKTRRAAEF